MTDAAHLIEVSEQVNEDVAATGASIEIAVVGSRLFVGDAARAQAVEVRKLIDALVAAGVSEEDVGIASVRVDTSKGLVIRSSSATYGLSVRCRDPNKVAVVIDAMSAQKNCRLHRVEWRYDIADEKHHQWLARCVQRARAAAEAMAAALGARISHVHRIVDETHGGSGEFHAPRSSSYGHGGSGFAKRARVVDSLADLELAPKLEHVVKIRAWFAIAI